jgi:hypothetical protein
MPDTDDKSDLQLHFENATGLNSLAECDVYLFYTDEYVVWLERHVSREIQRAYELHQKKSPHIFNDAYAAFKQDYLNQKIMEACGHKEGGSPQ